MRKTTLPIPIDRCHMIQIPSHETMLNRLHAARAMFLTNDSALLERGIHERALTHKFAEALQCVFRSWHVDCEFNRNGDQPKSVKYHKLVEESARSKDIDIRKKLVLPDIIIHRRGGVNLLIIEAKTNDASKAAQDFDRRKLKAYLDESLRYHYALFMTFNLGNDVGLDFEDLQTLAEA
jgi:hypothetical protein